MTVKCVVQDLACDKCLLSSQDPACFKAVARESESVPSPRSLRLEHRGLGHVWLTLMGGCSFHQDPIALLKIHFSGDSEMERFSGMK